MLWNELDFNFQEKVIDRIIDILKEDNSDDMQYGIMAAIHELECWSNSPCKVIDHGDITCITAERDPFFKEKI
jgi:hypothetical protein